MMYEQDRMIGRLQRKVMADSKILACFLSGSFGRRTEDSYSDLDIALVYKNKSTRDEAWNHRVDFSRSIMPYLAFKSFDADHIRTFFHIALYANGSKLDFRYEAQELLSPNPWDGQIRILKDTEGWAVYFQTASSQLAFPKPTISLVELIELDQRFWIMFWDIVRQVARGDTERPFTIYLELFNFTLPRMIEVLPLNEPARKALSEADYTQNSEKTAQSLSKLLNTYTAARSAIIRNYSLQFSADTAFESEIKKLLDRLI